MNEFQREIYKTIDILTDDKLKDLGFDKTKRGRVVSVSAISCVVEIDGEEYTCKLRRGIYVEVNDIVFVKFPQSSGVDKYVDTILGGNQTPEHLVVSAEEILQKLTTVDGHGSGLDADMLDGKHGSEYAKLEDLEGMDIDISGETIVRNINDSTSIIDDKNLSSDVLDKYTKSETDAKLNDKVDKVVGKQLSTEDYSSLEKSKLAGVESGANKYTHPPTHPYSMITGAPTSLPADGGNADTVSGKTVLSNVPVDAKFTDTIYTHPAKHPASIITETAEKRFVSDAEKSSWSGKQNALNFTPENSSNKGKASGYPELDTNAKIPLSQLPDIAKQQTYVVDTIAERNALTGLIVGEKSFITGSGDAYIWDGVKWVTLSKADWENVNLQWANILGKPNSSIVDIDDSVAKKHSHTNKSIIDTISQTFIDRWQSAWGHIADSIRHITSAERTKWNKVDDKADKAYVDNKVKTDVPTGAKFTDTITTVNNKTGAITKEDIVALGIPAQDTVIDVSGKADKSYVDTELGKKVDKVNGKGLSTEDYTLLEKTKLAGIQDGANKYVLPKSSETILGGVKVGANLSISADGTLNAMGEDAKSSFIKKQEMFTATQGQTVFNLLKGSYQPNTNTIAVYLQGNRFPNESINEPNSTSFKTLQPLQSGDIVFVEYIELSSANPYPIHGEDHLTGGYDPIPVATLTSDGLMKKEDKSKLDGVEAGANKYIHPTSHPANMITESASKRFVTDIERLEWNNKWDYNENTIKAVKVSNAINSDTVNGKTVAVNVPVGAKFTDTIYEHPESHLASMIIESATKRFVSDVEKSTWNAKETTSGSQAKANIALSSAKDYVDDKVKTDVPLNAKFTDTVYVHPSGTNPHGTTKSDVGLGNVTNTSDMSKPVSTAQQAALDLKANSSQVLTNVPDNAKFTDTITTVNGKTGAISKADIVALGIPESNTNTTYSEITTAEIDAGTSATLRTITGRRISYILDKVSTWISEITKSDIGLGNVDNLKQATKSEFDTHNTDSTRHISSVERGNWNTVGNKVDKVTGKELSTNDYTTTEKNKLAGIATGANNYTHPESHPASMIVENTTNRFTSDDEKANWNTVISKADKDYVDTELGKKVDNSKVLTDVPLNAKFTDTIYTHPTGAGNNHIPTGGTVGQILKNTASGTATWQTESVTPIANNLTETATGKALDATQGKILNDTKVNKAGDTLNGSYTGNGKLFLKNSFYGMGGQALNDFSMSGIYNRQELINVAHKGGVEVNIEGAGSVSRTKENLNLMFNGEPDFLNISSVNTTTTKIEIIADLGHRAEIYSDGNWQPFVQLRIAPGGSHNWFNKIRVEVSDDKINWSYPDDETAWGTDDFLNNQAIPSLWMGKNANPKPSSLWRYIRFIFTEIRGTSGNFWISQLGMRHRNAPYTKKYVTTTGDKMYGVLDMNNNKISNVATPTSLDDVATKKYVDDGLDSKVNNSRVLTDVPINAKFTDTIYTHPAGTNPHGTTKSDVGLPNVDNIQQATKSEFNTHNTDGTRHITGAERTTWNGKANVSQIPTKTSQLTNDSTYVTQADLGSAGLGDMLKGVYDTNNNGIVDNAEKVNGFTVGLDVPANAKFTDTIYTHPSSHPASFITESTTRRFVSDTEKSTWNGKANVSQIPTKLSQLQVDSPIYHVGNADTSNKNLLWINTSL